VLFTFPAASYQQKEKNKRELSKDPTLKTAINENIQHVSLPIRQYGQDTVIGIERTPVFVFRKMFQID